MGLGGGIQVGVGLNIEVRVEEVLSLNVGSDFSG